MEVCPRTSLEIADFTANRLKEKGAFGFWKDFDICKDLIEISKFMPEDYLPDTFIELSLINNNESSVFFILDSFECNRISFSSDADYFNKTGINDISDITHYDELTGFRLNKGKTDYIHTKNKLIYPPYCDLKDYLGNWKIADKLIKLIFENNLKFIIDEKENDVTISFLTGSNSAKDKFLNRDYYSDVIELLKNYGCKSEALESFEKSSVNFALPYYNESYGYLDWPVCVDVEWIKVLIKDGKIYDIKADFIITDKFLRCYKTRSKSCNFTQWHITDECDQRCKHCYLFAEDGSFSCVSTPLDKMIYIVDELSKYAAKENTYPYLILSGGDPILHPEFWNLVTILHERGIRWSILGNPFHLNPEVCLKLKQYGCVSYQISIDGLKPFHDYMRKPGSFDAGFEAIKFLNQAGIYSQIMATASKQNLDDIIECMDIAEAHLAGSFTFARYCATSPEKAKESYPSPEEYREFLLKYHKKSESAKKRKSSTTFIYKEHLLTLLRYELGDFVIPEYSKRSPDIVYNGCHLGQGVAILPNGDLLACRRMESLVGNIFKDDLSEVMESDLKKTYMDVKNIEKCKDCELLNWCRGCRAVGYNVTGDLQTKDPMCWR